MADRIESLSTSQREALADFQAITASEDLETAITILQSHDWDLAVRLRCLLDTRATLTPTSLLSPLWNAPSTGTRHRHHERKKWMSRNDL